MVPVSGPNARPSTEQVSPLKPPPYLASETARRSQAPVEPWSDSLKLVMLIFGVLLVGAFAAPWSVGDDKMVFAWSGLKQANTYGKIMPMMLAGTGVLAIVLGLLPLAAIGRGIAAAGLGMVPILYQKFGAGGKINWQDIAVIVGTLTLVGGLLLRSQYRRSMLSRILVTVGAIAVILPYVVPEGGNTMLVLLFKAIGDAPGKQKVSIILVLLPFVLACISLLAWLPNTTSAGAHVLAWCWIVLPIVLSVTTLIVAGDVGDRLKAGIGATVWQPAAKMAWYALTGYGVATILGKQLEHS